MKSGYFSKVVVVTGGVHGIGRCLAETFAAKGAHVAVIDRDGEEGARLASSLPGGGHLFVHGDVGKKEDMEAFAAQVLARYGHVDVLVNNACFSKGGLLGGCPYEDFMEVLRVGVAAPYELARLFMDRFGEGGAIVNIASTRAEQSMPDTESYSAAKGGIAALTHAMAMSLASRGIRVNCISPGWIQTEVAGAALSEADERQHPAGRAGVPEDVAKLALFLCGPDAGFINAQNVTADGGMSRQMIYHGEHGWSYCPGETAGE